MADERRIQHRHELSLSLQVFDSETDEFMGYLADIHTDGIMLFTEKLFPQGQDYLCEIRLQRQAAAIFYDDGRDKKIRFHARSVWSCPGEQSFFKTGFRLIDTTPGTIISITYMIRKFSKKP